MTQHYAYVFHHAAPELRHNRDFMASAILRACIHEIASHMSDYVAPQLWHDSEFVLRVVRSSPHLFLKAAPEVQMNRDIAQVVLEEDGLMLKNMATAFRRDRKMVLTAVWQNSAALPFAMEGLHSDWQLVLTAWVKCLPEFLRKWMEVLFWKWMDSPWKFLMEGSVLQASGQ